MTKEHFKSLAFTFLITTVWSVYVFFDYYADKSFMPGFTLYFDFFSADTFVIGLAVINLLLRFTIFRENNLQKFKDNFFYVFAAFSNATLAIVWFIYLIISKSSIIEFISAMEPATFYILLNLILGLFISFDIYIYKSKIIEE